MQHIWGKVEEFRLAYPSLREGFVPVDVISFAEIDLKLDLIPFPNLSNRYQVDAAIKADFSGMYVDEEQYLMIDNSPPWKIRRLRFTIAHEIGHYMLHKDLPQSKNFSSLPDFALWTDDYGGNKYQVEAEANEFAGRLLVPRQRLVSELDDANRRMKEIAPALIGSKAAREAFCNNGPSIFNVTELAISIRLDREGLWPAGD